MSILSIRDLSKSFKTNKVIDGLNFNVPEGSIFGFIGPNGAGKTTTMRMALGLLEIDSGDIIICGEKAEELSGGFDIVVDATGSADGFALACRLTKTAGTLSLFGCHRGLRHFDGDDWHTKGLKVLNTAPSCDPHYFTRGPQAAVLMKKGVFDLQRLVTHVCSYHGAQALFETALYKKDGYIKGVVTF